MARRPIPQKTPPTGAGRSGEPRKNPSSTPSDPGRAGGRPPPSRRASPFVPTIGDVTRAREEALLQLRLGRQALYLGLLVGAVLFVDSYLSLLLETTGYFFLAFSHAVDVMFSKKMGAAFLLFPVITLSGTQLQDVLSFFAFYFVLYGVVETIYSYARTKRPDTLFIAMGLSLISVGTFFQWLSLLYQYVGVLSLLQIILQEMGLLILFTPVLRFAVGGVRIDGAV